MIYFNVSLNKILEIVNLNTESSDDNHSDNEDQNYNENYKIGRHLFFK